MSTAILEFNGEVATKLKEKYGEKVASEFLGIYHRLNGSPFKNFAWLKELDFVKRQQEKDSEEQRKRNLEAIVAGLELFKDLKAYGKIYNHYKKEQEGGSVIEAVMPPSLEVSEVKNEVVVPKIDDVPKKEKRVRKPKPKEDIPDKVSDICGAIVPVDKELVRASKKKSKADPVSTSVTSQSPSVLIETEKKSVMIEIKPKMNEKQKKALLEKVRSLLYDV